MGTYWEVRAPHGLRVRVGPEAVVWLLADAPEAWVVVLTCSRAKDDAPPKSASTRRGTYI
eukprot:SAG31_NODE_745_length_12408_cov_4.755057_7_plen_60_part_00